jgi:predicted ATPase/serine/threonine protein kinase
MPGAAHLDENSVAQLLDGLLSDEERRTAAAHVDACDDCQALLAAVARSCGQEPASTLAPEAPDAREALSPRSLQGGALFGRYVILDRRGAGGMGVVYGAYDTRLDRRVALKLLQPGSSQAATAEGRVSLLREAQSMARLSHPNVVAVYDAGVIGGEVYLAMEFVEGKTLRQWVSDRPRSWHEVLAMYLQAGQGLAAAHKAELLHGDFKPDNVLVDRTGRARVADFGLAWRAPPRPAPELDQRHDPAPATIPTRVGSVAGTPAYMAPEQLAGAAADQRSDQFAFCVALYESLYGERPFERELVPGLPAAKRAMRVAPTGSPVPPWLRRALSRGLADVPDQRYASFDELLSALRYDPLGPATEPCSAPAVPNDSRARSGPAQSPRSLHAAGGPRPAQAERRQTTVMSCDLADSAHLSSLVAPGELRELLRTYHEVAGREIERFEGHVAQHPGDGMLVYFGYPHAHEDDPHRAIRSGLAIIAAMEHVNADLQQRHQLPIALRIGIHTGPVVVGDVGEEHHHEQLAMPETPNIAVRLQTLARPDQLVISERTRHLVGAAFDLKPLGEQVLDGIREPLFAHEVRGESEVEDRFEAATANGLSPLVGREAELALLLERWEAAKGGEGQALVLVGDPGIGKSRLVQALRRELSGEPHTRVTYQCSPYHTNSAFFPLALQLERAARFSPTDRPEEKLAKLESLLSQAAPRDPDTTSLMAAMLSLPVAASRQSLNLSPQRQRSRTIEALGSLLVGLCRRGPILLVLEDAQWGDPTTLDVLSHFVDLIPEHPVLALITCRPEFHAGWQSAEHVTTLRIQRLSRAHSAALAACITRGRVVPSSTLEQIVLKADGVPLFIEELAKHIVESAVAVDGSSRAAALAQVPPIAIPATLQDALMSRLDRLAPVKDVAQVGAILGREFSHELLAAVAPLQGFDLEAALDQLVAAQLFSRHGDACNRRYRFRHALIRDAAYASLLEPRRIQLHAHVAAALARRAPELVAGTPEVLAHHYTEAGMAEQAVPCWLRAGAMAYWRSANAEAIAHLSRGLELLTSLPEGAVRAQAEVGLQSQLGMAFVVARGYASPEAEGAFRRAHELCQQIGEAPQLSRVIYGLFMYHWARGNLATADVLAKQLSAIASAQADATLQLVARTALSNVAWHVGRTREAESHALAALQLYDFKVHSPLAAEFAQDLGVMSNIYCALARLVQGRLQSALESATAAIALARATHHPFSLCGALALCMPVAMMRGDFETVLEWADECTRVSLEQGFPHWQAMANIHRGWTLAQQGRSEEGLRLIREGIAGWQACGAQVALPWFFSLAADAYLANGQSAEALAVADEAQRWMTSNGDYVHQLYVIIVRGRALCALGREEEGQAELKRALSLEPDLRGLHLFAAIHLARRWQRQGKVAEAAELLGNVYRSYSEGLDAPIFQRARALLDSLAS